MKQYNSIKSKHPDALLLFRVGDFYETFGSDAIKASKILGIVLTQRKNGAAAQIELAGFPHHSLDTYLPKLVRAGQRVAICDQLEDPKATKKIVKRGITELVTPGVTLSDQVLEHKKNNFLAAVHFDKKVFGVSFLDISTGEFLTAQGNQPYIDKLLQSFSPSEVLIDRRFAQQFAQTFGQSYFTYYLDDWIFNPEFGQETLLKQFGTKSLKGFGIEGLTAGIIASGACLHYLSATEHHQTQHIQKISRIEENEHVWLDRFTIRNLELFNSPNQGARTLIDILDKTASPMGARQMRRWMALPLKNEAQIKQRHDIVDYFMSHETLTDLCVSHIGQMGDLERLISKVAVQRINPRELLHLKKGLQAIIPIKTACTESNSEPLSAYGDQLHPCEQIIQKLHATLASEAPAQLVKGGVIANGVNKELDELRGLAHTSKDFLAQMQKREMENTGITSLKVSYNNVFGYYFEVRNTHKDKVPEAWIRKQTLVNAERYITPELKEYESKILGAEDKIRVLEATLFQELVKETAAYTDAIQANSIRIASLDCLLSFASLAKINNYCRPLVSNDLELDITGGRHPVIEQQLSEDQAYVSNDVRLQNDDQQILMITGPNMSGKSALLRQTALIVLMAQMGSFVPADAAQIGIIDKLFTRVGASDNISMGESTFMVEMNETASILNNLSERSLILLDEIGRGTSTYDGISIAWAIAEFIHTHKAAPKTLFATHYHELNEMSKSFPRIRNYNVSIKEVDHKIVFLRKLVPGGSNHSFGIHVAKLAGIPKEVLLNAQQVLHQLESNHANKSAPSDLSANKDDMQLSFFQLDDPTLVQIKQELQSLDINSLTPVEALLKLNEIKKHIGA